MADYSKAFAAMEAGTASFADAVKINEAAARLKPYLDEMHDKASKMVRVREQLDAVLAVMPQGKKNAILAVLDN